MSRTTQYIGLKPKALTWLEKSNARQIARWVMTEGLCMEAVHGSIYEVPPMSIETEGMSGYQPSTYVEVEDKTLWSGGPMIHTCLMHIPSGKRCFEWKDEELFN